jgi:predicted GNAT superfamily acetyltransferase
VGPSPWEHARRAADAAGVRIVPLRGVEDVRRVAGVCEALWGAQSVEPATVRALQHAGCVLYGAEAGAELVGFVFGFLGWEDGLHLHSHMLGVRPEWQSRGVGFALKLAQRAACLDRGVEEVRWTFDPLVPRNGRFNLVKLGAVAPRFFLAFYGEMGDRINRGDRTDRLEAVWRLRSERVERALGGERDPARAGPVVLEAAGDDVPRPRLTGRAPEPGAVVEVPADHHALRARDPGLGRVWREASGEALEACVRAGLVATWAEVGGTVGRYVFEATG